MNSPTGAPAPQTASRRAGSLPFPDRSAGTVNDKMPFDHIIVVMMENHSFDNLSGDLGRTRTDVDALSFDSSGTATNSNPGPEGKSADSVTAFPFADIAQTKNVTQSWAATHEQINGGAMNGFIRPSKGAREPMGYWPTEVVDQRGALPDEPPVMLLQQPDLEFDPRERDHA